ncbi:CTP-dependent diacylglycerol kinase 1 [Ceratocystis lukuohia]|uniref:CTP-dependent diacylglycerol kinase 1 n=1 Tax=Ceratocystis lukuohia TaxID=2019550 RepID=A0ABR4MSJ4_9PEZI
MPMAPVPQGAFPAARPVAAEVASRQTSSPSQSQAQGLNQDPDSNSSDSNGQQRANQKRARGSQAHASQDKSQTSWSSAISASATGAEYLLSSGKPRARSPAGSTPAEIPADTNSLVASQSLKLHPQCRGSPPLAPPIPQVIVQPAEVAHTSTSRVSTELLPPSSPLALSISPLASPNALPTLSIASEAALSLSVETPPPPPPPLETPESLEFSLSPLFLPLPLPLPSPQSSSFWSLFFSLPDLTIHHRPCCLGVLSLSPTAQGPALPLFSSRLLAFCWSSPSPPPQSSPHHHRRRFRRTMAAPTRSQQRASKSSDHNSPSTPTKQTFSLADMDASSVDYSGPVTRSVARRRTTSRPASSVAPATPSTRNSASTRRHQPQPSTSIPEQSPSLTDSSIDSIDDFDHNDNNNLGRDNIHNTDDLDTASSNDSPLGSKTNSSLPLKTLSTVDSSSSSAATLQNQQNNSQANMRHPKKSLPTLLAPPSPSAWNWDLNRCPSPLGLIPIHSQWRAFIHKHEVPRKALHVSIGFFSLWLYVSGTQTTSVTPWLMGALIPITVVDVLRHNVPSFNAFYVRVLGALMRESEYSGYNGVIFYLLGAWTALYFFPKDVGLLGVMLLSWCDTAASTFGRLYGRYTPKVRRGKSLAGSLAAMLTGIATALYFWGYLAPRVGFMPGDEHFPFMFTGELHLPAPVTSLLSLTPEQATVSGSAALGIVSVFTGFIASMSEVVDLFGWDDNLTIPVLSSLGVWGFLKIFG